ncbi:ABC transporter ATP-binding protein [Saccharothrix violaceirubra]
MVLGLDRPTAGTATVNGRAYAELHHPLREVGAVLDTRIAHPRTTARDHLRVLAVSHGIPVARVDEVLDLVGLTEAARERIGKFSLGMRQRFGLAVALLGDPPTLLFDEPLNGLDVAGVHWVRKLLRGFADEGRTVLVSSHLMAEVQGTADRLVVIGRGRLVADARTADFIADTVGVRVRVETPDARAFVDALTAAGADVDQVGTSVLLVSGMERHAIGDLAARASLVVHGLADEVASLEEAFLDATESSVEFRGKPEWNHA